MALRDLLVRFGIEVVGQQELVKTDAQIRDTIRSAERFGNTLRRIGQFLLAGTIIAGVKKFVTGQLEAADALKHNAEKLGLTTDELQKYQYAAEQMNVSTQETAVAMRFFNRAVGEAALGTKSATKVFSQLGISIKDAGGQVKPTDELLFEFSDKLKKMPSQAQRTAFAMRTLGRGGASLLPVLQQGSEKLRQVFKDVDELGGGFNEKFIQQSHEVDVQLKRLRMGWRSIYVALASELLPILKRWTENAIKTVKVLIDFAKHTYGVRTALMALAAGSTIYALSRLMKLFNPFKASIGDIFRALLANAPLVIFVALLGLAYLAIDDLYTFIQGGDSVLGRFLDQIGGQGTALKFWQDLKAAWDQLQPALAPAIQALKDFGLEIFKAFVDNLPAIIEWGGIFVTTVVSAIDSAVSGLREMGTLVGGILAAVKDTVTLDFHGQNPIKDALNDIDKQNEAWDKRMQAYSKVAQTFHEIGNPKGIGKAGPPPSIVNPDGSLRLPAPPSPGAGGAQITINNTIHGASDPKSTAAAVGAATKTAVKSGLAQHRDTYAAVNAGMPSTGQ